MGSACVFGSCTSGTPGRKLITRYGHPPWSPLASSATIRTAKQTSPGLPRAACLPAPHSYTHPTSCLPCVPWHTCCAEDVKLTGGAALEKGHFTWITEKGRQERWVVASCGNYTVLWNFRWVLARQARKARRAGKARKPAGGGSSASAAAAAAPSTWRQAQPTLVALWPFTPLLRCPPCPAPAGLSRWLSQRLCRTAG